MKVLTLPLISKFIGKIMSSRFSTLFIKRFITKNNINMEDFEDIKYSSYNDFFTRKIKDNKRKADLSSTSFISPCDSKLSVYKITEDLEFNIKGTNYSIYDLLQSDDLAKKYINGQLLIFRLCVDDYHRYCYVDNGYHEDNIYIKGLLHTVQPIAFKKYDVYKTNCREYTILHTQNFGDVVQVEVGALLVGKIKNIHNNYTFKKGEEKGYFEFGGSTICLLVENNKVEILKHILKNTQQEFETVVKYGERIGTKIENSNN